MKKAQVNSNESQNKKINKKTTSPSAIKAQNARESLREFKERMRKSASKSDNKFENFVVEDFYGKAANSITSIKKRTGICFDDFMSLHKCIWDPNYPECPDRYFAVLNRCKELGLIDRCERIKPRQAKRETISKVHDKNLYLKLKEICEIKNENDLEKKASSYDAIYFNEHTFEASLYAAGCCIEVAENVARGIIKNGFAIVRPPGHHAMYDEFCGYCYFNNVAVAARHILDQNLAQKILIVDFDVHHGQATQRAFYDNNSVLYFSIHRYENGTFWPNLRESDYDFIGKDMGRGFNINVPLNSTCLGDSDYLAIVQHILLPVAYEGNMLVTPAFYGHLIHLLSGLACGKIVACLEGGYFLPSLSEGAAVTLAALLGDPPPMLSPMQKPQDCVVDVINNLKFVLKSYWGCFRILDTFVPNEESADGVGLHSVRLEYLEIPALPPYETRNCYPLANNKHIETFSDKIEELQREYKKRSSNQAVCYCYDEDMLLHKTKKEDGYEEPARLRVLLEKFSEFGLEKRCKKIDSRPAELDVLEQTHAKDYVANISDGSFDNIDMSKRDIYTCDDSTKSILKSAGCLLSVVDEVMKGGSRSGAAFIRPPGHHAEYKRASGFCFINNISVAANYILNKYSMQRVLIVDFDIHHGNGTQSLFYESQNVLYISIHRYDNAHYFPHSEEANLDKVGRGDGEGFNVNIPLNRDKHGNAEYLTVFHRIILPIAYSFAPEVVLVSAGFDAGINDPLGHYRLAPEAFGHFIQLLRSLANGRVILALEGGYNPTTLAYGMISCVKTLLDDPLPLLDVAATLNESAHATIENVINMQKRYWPVLEVNKKLPTDIDYLKIFDGKEFVEVERPTLKYLNCSVEELKQKLHAQQDHGDMDSVAKQLEKVSLKS